MPRKKLYERKISDVRHEVRLFEITDAYVKQKAKIEGKTQTEIVRELCEAARLEELTRGQFSVGTTKIFQSVQGKLLKQNVVSPLEVLTQVIADLSQKISEMELNSRFMEEEIFKVLKAFMIENQVVIDTFTNKNSLNKDALQVERERIKRKFTQEFESRYDKFYQKYRVVLEAINQQVLEDLHMEQETI